MAVAFVSPAYTATTLSGATLTASSVGASSGNVVLAFVSWRQNSGQTISGVTQASVSMSQIGSTLTIDGRCLAAFYLLSTTDGDCVATFSAAPGNAQMTVMVFSGAHGTTPIGTEQTSTSASATSTSTSAVTSDSDGLVVDGLATSDTSSHAPDGSQTQRSSLTTSSSIDHFTSTKPGAASVTMSWSWTDSVAYRHIVVPIAPAGAGGSLPTITDAGDETYTNGETGIVITGTNFGASQGSGTVKISPTDDVDDVNAVEQTVTAWGDTSVTFTCVKGSLAFNTNLYLFVTADGGYSNAAGHVVQIVGTRKLKVLTHSSAAGATSIDVAVYAAPTTEPIHGALIGQATGQAFEASLESGQAVLKVPVSAFGGGALTTSDTPRVLARNATYTTGNIPATVIEE